MHWLDWMERRFGAWSIPQFPLFIAAANGAIYILSLTQPAFYQTLLLDPAAVFAGQWWRILTFIFVPPLISPFFLVFWLLLIYQYAQALENAWGEFRFCFFYVLGALAIALTSLFIVREPLGNVQLNMTLFLAFATLFPEFQLLLFFILPVKVKYLAWVMWAGLALSMVRGPAVTRIAIAASLVNYALFCGPQIVESARLRWEVWRNRRR